MRPTRHPTAHETRQNLLCVNCHRIIHTRPSRHRFAAAVVELAEESCRQLFLVRARVARAIAPAAGASVSHSPMVTTMDVR